MDLVGLLWFLLGVGSTGILGFLAPLQRERRLLNQEASIDSHVQRGWPGVGLHG